MSRSFRLLFAPRALPLLILLLTAVVLVELTSAQSPAAKKPITHADYDGWNAVQQPVLSRDGRYFAYNLMPQDADGQFVVRNIATGGEHRVPRGKSGIGVAGAGAKKGPPATAPGESADDGWEKDQKKGFGKGGGAFGKGTGLPVQTQAPNPLASAAHQFTPDSKSIVFALIPTKTEVDKAKAEKKAPAEMPRPVVAVMDLSSGKVTTKIERVSSFTVAGNGAGQLVYRRQTKGTEKTEPKKEEKKEEPKTEKKDDKPAPKTPPRTFGSDLILRNLADGAERVLADVTDYSITRDGKLLVYIVSSKNEENNGVYALSPLPDGPASPLSNGKGKYSRLTWDDKQAQLVFFSEKDDAAAEKAKAKLYYWSRTAEPSGPLTPNPSPPQGRGGNGGKGPKEANIPVYAAATDLLSLKPDGIRPGWSISDRGAVSFSLDGSRLFLTTAEDKAEEKKEAKKETPVANTPGSPKEEKAVFELWHYKDELIQPMQKVRGLADGARAHRAVYFLKDKLFRHLTDKDSDVNVNPLAAGDWALTSNNKPYKKLTGYGPNLTDFGLVNIRTGEARSLVSAWQWQPVSSHDGKHLVYFDGKDWNAVAAATGKRINLTAKLPTKFVVETWDQPSEAPAYGFGGWTSDAKHVLLDDRYDIWKVAVDGSDAKMLTAGMGRKTRTQFRISRAGFGGLGGIAGLPATPAEDGQRGTNLSKPLLLKAVNEYTRDEGFYRLEPGAAEPKLLVMGARAYGTPIKAKDMDTYLLTISTCYDYPDYFVTGADFREFKRVTNANPKKDQFLWGKSELIRYKNTDGVELSGVLIKPENFDPHKKYPLMVYIYERLSQNLHKFTMPNAGTSINPTYYVSNGYLVLMPDIVYTVGSPGQSAMKCVLPAVQAVVDRGCVDENAIGIQGHSWGGYQIAYMVTQTSRFKAAAPGALVSNMVSAYDGIRWGTGLPRQFQYERTQSRIGATLWQAPQKFIENSPIFMADRVQTPLLMLHNDQDDAVPWYQGIEYYLALRRLGKECYMFNYNGEAHGLKKKVNQRDYTVRLQQFFDHHLKGAPKPDWMEKGIPARPREGAPTTPAPPPVISEREK
ncbi:MAG: prolyl oligopeptidase family serine peptidase [Gemmataceae bacterium]|nr:prolyl oligopeptidase family serine peptidase [Gemmataceae bacterium]